MASKQEKRAAYEAIQAAESKLEKAQAAIDKARAEVTHAVIQFVTRFGSEKDGEYSHAPFLVDGQKVQPILRKSDQSNVELNGVTVTGFIKRWTDEKDLESI